MKISRRINTCLRVILSASLASATLTGTNASAGKNEDTGGLCSDDTRGCYQQSLIVQPAASDVIWVHNNSWIAVLMPVYGITLRDTTATATAGATGPFLVPNVAAGTYGPVNVCSDNMFPDPSGCGAKWAAAVTFGKWLASQGSTLATDLKAGNYAAALQIMNTHGAVGLLALPGIWNMLGVPPLTSAKMQAFYQAVGPYWDQMSGCQPTAGVQNGILGSGAGVATTANAGLNCLFPADSNMFLDNNTHFVSAATANSASATDGKWPDMAKFMETNQLHTSTFEGAVDIIIAATTAVLMTVATMGVASEFSGAIVGAASASADAAGAGATFVAADGSVAATVTSTVFGTTSVVTDVASGAVLSSMSTASTLTTTLASMAASATVQTVMGQNVNPTSLVEGTALSLLGNAALNGSGFNEALTSATNSTVTRATDSVINAALSSGVTTGSVSPISLASAALNSNISISNTNTSAGGGFDPSADSTAVATSTASSNPASGSNDGGSSGSANVQSDALNVVGGASAVALGSAGFTAGSSGQSSDVALAAIDSTAERSAPSFMDRLINNIQASWARSNFVPPTQQWGVVDPVLGTPMTCLSNTCNVLLELGANVPNPADFQDVMGNGELWTQFQAFAGQARSPTADDLSVQEAVGVMSRNAEGTLFGVQMTDTATGRSHIVAGMNVSNPIGDVIPSFYGNYSADAATTGARGFGADGLQAMATGVGFDPATTQYRVFQVQSVDQAQAMMDADMALLRQTGVVSADAAAPSLLADLRTLYPGFSASGVLNSALIVAPIGGAIADYGTNTGTDGAAATLNRINSGYYDNPDCSVASDSCGVIASARNGITQVALAIGPTQAGQTLSATGGLINNVFDSALGAGRSLVDATGYLEARGLDPASIDAANARATAPISNGTLETIDVTSTRLPSNVVTNIADTVSGWINSAGNSYNNFLSNIYYGAHKSK